MTHLEIKNQNSNVEIVDKSLISKLYLEAKTIKDYEELNDVEESLVDLSGNLQVDKAFGDEVDWLNNTFDNLHVNVSIGRYINFADTSLFSRMMLYLGDGTGITSDEITNANWYSNTTDPNTNSTLFTNNTAITSFNELGSLPLITSIPSNMFSGCTNLISIDLSNIVTIGQNSFVNTGITGVLNLLSILTINGAAFSGCSNITEVHFGSNLTTLSGFDIFKNCTSLTTVTGFENFTGDTSPNLFQGCSSLVSITLNSLHGIINDAVFFNCSNLECVPGLKLGRCNETVLYLPFSGCSKLKCVDLDFTNTGQATAVFNGCSQLADLTTNDPSNINTGEATYTISWTKMRGATFSNCTSLTNKSLIFPNLTMITEYSTFYNCGAKSFSAPLLTLLGYRTFQSSKFQTIDIPSVTSIPEQTFINCTSLTSINLSNNVTTIYNEAFKGCTALTTIGNLSNCTLIGRGAFLGCSNLDKTDWDLSNVTTLGLYAFGNCSELKGTLNLSGVLTVDAVTPQLFSGCSNLLKIILGHMPSVYTWRGNADRSTFYMCDSLKVVDINLLDEIVFSNKILINNNVFLAFIIRNANTIPTITLDLGISSALWSNFTSSSNAKIYVTDALYSTYINHADWSNLASHIEPLSNYVAS